MLRIIRKGAERKMVNIVTPLYRAMVQPQWEHFYHSGCCYLNMGISELKNRVIQDD